MGLKKTEDILSQCSQPLIHIMKFENGYYCLLNETFSFLSFQTSARCCPNGVTLCYVIACHVIPDVNSLRYQ